MVVYTKTTKYPSVYRAFKALGWKKTKKDDPAKPWSLLWADKVSRSSVPCVSITTYPYSQPCRGRRRWRSYSRLSSRSGRTTFQVRSAQCLSGVSVAVIDGVGVQASMSWEQSVALLVV